MKLKKIFLKNFRQYEKEEIVLPNSSFIVIIGINGAGKTTLLDGISMCISHIVGRLTSPKDEYYIQYSIESKDILNGKTNSAFTSELSYDNQPIKITVTKEIDKIGNKFDFEPKYPFKVIKEDLLKNAVSELPLLVYYRANRSFKIKDDSKSGSYYAKQLNGYRFSTTLNTSAFSPFEKWILTKENIENEKKIELKDFDFSMPALKVIRKAVESFMTELHENSFSSFRGKRKEDSNFDYGNSTIGELVIKKGDETIMISQLSSGEKSVISLVADLAVRLSILNKESSNALSGNGIVLIDELDMHLHPKWQRNLIPALKKVFPNVQFIATTHSPQIISRISDKDIIILSDKKHYSASSNPLGRDSNGILEEIFDTVSRPKEVETLLSNIFSKLSKENISETKEMIRQLETQVAKNDPVLKKIESIRERIKLLNS